ncbi:hypothetical protein ES703_44041 [subsurface metagenome]
MSAPHSASKYPGIESKPQGIDTAVTGLASASMPVEKVAGFGSFIPRTRKLLVPA